MIIGSKDKVQVNGKNKSVWVLDTDALTVTYNTPDAEPSVTTFSSDHIERHLHYSAEYHPASLIKLVNDGAILGYLTELDRFIAEAIERQVEKWKEVDKEYLSALAIWKKKIRWADCYLIEISMMCVDDKTTLNVYLDLDIDGDNVDSECVMAIDEFLEEPTAEMKRKLKYFSERFEYVRVIDKIILV